jgi:hypothetical protein
MEANLSDPGKVDTAPTTGGPPRRAFWLGLAIFVLAAALRVSLVSTARFTGDESRDYAVGMNIAHGQSFPLLGPVMSGGQARLPGPLFYWLETVPYLFSRAPEAGNLFFELLGALTVWLFWSSLRPAFGEAGAAFAAILMALSPWSALFGDRVWNPHAFLLCEGVALLAVVRLRQRPESRWALALPVACLALPQLHMSAPVVWVALLPLAAESWRRWNRRYLVIGVVLGLLLYIPFAVSELRTGLGNTHAFLSETFAAKKSGAASLSFLLTPLYVLRFLTLDVTYHELSGYWGGLNEPAAWHALWYGSPARPFHPLRLAALLASGGLLLLAIGVAARNGVRRARASGGRAISRFLGPFGCSAALVVALDLAFLALTRKQVFAHYVSLTIPFVFVIYADLYSSLGEPGAGGRSLRPLAIGLAMIFCAGGVEATRSISARIDGRNGLAVHRAACTRVLGDLAAAGRAPAEQPVRLDIGYMANLSQYTIFTRYALRKPVRWEGSPGAFVYRLQKNEDPPPVSMGGPAFETTRVGPVSLYRLR